MESLPPNFGEVARKRILIVDGDAELRDVIARQARSLGYRADNTGDITHARALAAVHAYDLVLTELALPGGDGMQLVAELASSSPLCAFVVMTSVATLVEYTASRVDQRITGVLNKPFETDALARAIGHAFEVAAKRRALDSDVEFTVMVLLVEDSDSSADVVQTALAKLGGFECFRVERLADAIESVHNARFDTIITDLSLPDARGLDAVIRLRQAAPEATLIVCSGAEEDALALQVIELGAQDFLVKGSYDVDTMGRAVRFARVRRQGERRLARMAFTDALTGLWNRAVFSERLDEALAQAKRHGSRLGVVYVDLDGFKAVNDTHGHDAGDQLLVQIATRLRDVVREYDTVARLGGDEFAVMVTHLTPGALLATAERVATAVAIPVTHGGARFQVTASIGVAEYPEHATDAVLLLKLADDAMYRSKRSGKSQVQAPQPQALDAKV
jgi:two-component system, cell cycle response regulator